jgi:hypothetical protein
MDNGIRFLFLPFVAFLLSDNDPVVGGINHSLKNWR